MDVKGRNGIALRLCVLQKIFGRNNTHEPVLLSLPRMNNDAWTTRLTVPLADGVSGVLPTCRDWVSAKTGVHQEAECLLHIVK